MKRLLLLTDGWRTYISSAWTAGIVNYIRSHGNDCTLSQFHCWGNWSQDGAFNEGEYAIFSLPNLRAYDGIIVDLTNIESTRVRGRVATAVVSSGKPAVTLCNQEEGMYCVRMDNRGAVRQLFEHLYGKHGCRTFHFIGSSQESAESADRERTFLEECEEHGIEVTEDMVYRHDYTAATGKEAARCFFRPDGTLRMSLPDAFVCANDNIAVGLIMEMRKHGLRCPEDFLVTGFDNLDKAMYFQPQVTTVSLNREQLGYKAAEVVLRLIGGEAVPENTYLPAEVVFSESCGCPNSGRVHYRDYLSWQVEDQIEQTDRNEELMRFALQLGQEHTLDELARLICEKYAEYDLDAVYALFDDRFGLGSVPSGYFDSGHLFIRWALERKGKTGAAAGADDAAPDQTADAAAASAADAAPSSAHDPEKMAACREALVPSPDMQGWSFAQFGTYSNQLPGGICLFTMPLHIRDRIAGMIIFVNPRFLVDEWRVFDVQNLVLRTLGEWEENRQLRESLRKLRKVYDRDHLTGLYSKAAFNSRLVPWFARLLQEGKQAAVFFLDIDHFKLINDTYGHEGGDQVLQETAQILQEIILGESYLFRYGGDEFLAVMKIAGKEGPAAKSPAGARAEGREAAAEVPAGARAEGREAAAKTPAGACVSAADLSALRDRLYAALREERIAASIGIAISRNTRTKKRVPGSRRDGSGSVPDLDAAHIILDRCIHEADRDMYRCKEIHHRQGTGCT